MTESVENFQENIGRCSGQVPGQAPAGPPGPPGPSGLVVAVITVCGSLSTRINIQRLMELFTLYAADPRNTRDFEMVYAPGSRREKTFYNCLSLKFSLTDSAGVTSRIIAKIFPNGSISVPGCRTIQAVHEAPARVLDCVRRVSGSDPGHPAADPGLLRLADVRIVMINSNFTFGRVIDQERLKDLLNAAEGQWRTANFQPEKYSGVNIRYFTRAGLLAAQTFTKSGMKIPFKMSGQLSIFVFRSGKCTITGAKSSSDILEAYTSITKVVEENPWLFKLASNKHGAEPQLTW